MRNLISIKFLYTFLFMSFFLYPTTIDAIAEIRVENVFFECSPGYIGYTIVATGDTDDGFGFDMLSYSIFDGVGNLVGWDTFGVGATEVERENPFYFAYDGVYFREPQANPVTFNLYEATSHGDFGELLATASFISPCISNPPEDVQPTIDPAIQREQQLGVTRLFQDRIVIMHNPNGDLDYYMPNGCLIGRTPISYLTNALRSDRYILQTIEGCGGYRVDVWSLGHPACQIQINMYGPGEYENVHLLNRDTSHPSCTPPPCPSGVGPGGIPAGDYPAGRLTQAQRQWLFERFGNSGTAPVGYGGQRCGPGYHNNAFDNFTAYVCARGDVGPGGIRAGDYGAGDLTQQQRQWLFEQFGNTGVAPVGYGGERCPGEGRHSERDVFIAQVCSSGYIGPNGMVPGGYNAGDLTTEQRRWLWGILGHQGTPPIGYGGEHCPGQTANYPAPDRSVTVVAGGSPPRNVWQQQSTVRLCQGTQIRTGSGLQYPVTTVVPVDNWEVVVINGPRIVNGMVWWDVSRAAAGDPSGGTGWVVERQSDCLIGALPVVPPEISPPPSQVQAPPASPVPVTTSGEVTTPTGQVLGATTTGSSTTQTETDSTYFSTLNYMVNTFTNGLIEVGISLTNSIFGQVFSTLSQFQLLFRSIELTEVIRNRDSFVDFVDCVYNDYEGSEWRRSREYIDSALRVACRADLIAITGATIHDPTCSSTITWNSASPAVRQSDEFYNAMIAELGYLVNLIEPDRLFFEDICR